MVPKIQSHIQLRGENPLDAVIAGTHHKAYLVANLALKDGPKAAAAHYDIGLSSVHGAIAFYYDNETAIDAALQSARDLGEQLGARPAQTALDEIRRRGDES